MTKNALRDIKRKTENVLKSKIINIYVQKLNYLLYILNIKKFYYE